MPSTALDSTIFGNFFGNFFGTEEMRALFEDRALVQRYLDVEATLARVQGQLGIIPQAAADEIARKARVENIDFDAYIAGVNRVGFPIVALVQQLVAISEDNCGRV